VRRKHGSGSKRSAVSILTAPPLTGYWEAASTAATSRKFVRALINTELYVWTQHTE
jgi:hypothetical protein